MSMVSTENQKIIKINLDNLSEIVQKGVRRVAVFMGLGLNAAQNESFRNYKLTGISHIQFLPDNVDEKTLSHFKEEFGVWIVTAGLRELIETFAIFLDAVHEVCQFVAVHRGKLSSADADASQKDFQFRGLKDKLKALETRFGIKPESPELLQGINQARHCLTHRRGIVGPEDCESGELAIKWPAMDIFIETPSGQTIPLNPPLKEGIYLQGGGTVKLKFVQRSVTFPLGSVIKLAPKELSEVCHFALMSAGQVCKSIVEYLERMGIPVENKVEEVMGTKAVTTIDAGKQ